MAQVYGTKDGDVLDLLCYKQYPNQDYLAITMMVYAANPGLAAHGPILPAGLIIEFPEAPTIKPKKINVVKFWS
jgi:phage tail protein X